MMFSKSRVERASRGQERARGSRLGSGRKTGARFGMRLPEDEGARQKQETGRSAGEETRHENLLQGRFGTSGTLRFGGVSVNYCGILPDML